MTGHSPPGAWVVRHVQFSLARYARPPQDTHRYASRAAHVSANARTQAVVEVLLVRQRETNMAEIYEDGTYLEHHPSWHEEDSPWKARQILGIIERNSLNPKTICEVGCGAGEILNQLAAHYGDTKQLIGYEISPQAFALCSKKAKPHLTFTLGDLLSVDTDRYDLVMAIDVFEHVEDYFGFLRKLRAKAEYKIFHIPLDLSVQSILRASPILKARRLVGHIHYFTKETALEALKDTGYKVLDYSYTGGTIELPNRGWKANLLKLPRRLAYALHGDMAVRVLGGYSLLVLAQ
jgi:2-polyprenyl-3-methyl-5-hydroxy-6-metoxy-1,4-benzoquinol methylase